MPPDSTLHHASRAVRYSRYGGIDVLDVVDVEVREPGAGQVLVDVVMSDVNPGESLIRSGAFQAFFPAHFPEGHGNTLAGLVARVGPDVDGFGAGDAVIGFAPRAAHAERVVVDAGTLTAKPAALSWEVAPTLPGVGVTAWAAVEAVAPTARDTVVVSGGAGGVGHLAVQLARLRGARVIATAAPRDHDYLRELGAEPVDYAADLKRALPSGITAWIDCAGHGSVELAVSLGVAAARINSIAEKAKARRLGARTEAQEEAFTPALVAHLAGLVVDGSLKVRIAGTYPLERVRDAYARLERGAVGGKLILRIAPDPS